MTAEKKVRLNLYPRLWLRVSYLVNKRAKVPGWRSPILFNASSIPQHYLHQTWPPLLSQKATLPVPCHGPGNPRRNFSSQQGNRITSDSSSELGSWECHWAAGRDVEPRVDMGSLFLVVKGSSILSGLTSFSSTGVAQGACAIGGTRLPKGAKGFPSSFPLAHASHWASWHLWSPCSSAQTISS